MRIQIASDLHLEFLEALFPEFRGVEDCHADVLVLAGDIANGTRALDLFAGWHCPVVYVPGNHEYYGSDVAALGGSFAQRAAAATGVHVLAPGVWTHHGVRFIGCTLWTDYAVFGAALQTAAMAVCGARLLDHERIRCDGDAPFAPAHALALHQAQRQWLRAELARPHAGATVVVTHHAPSPASIHPRWSQDLTSAGFASDLGADADGVTLWVHGHTHDSFDYRMGTTRVVANPMGYCGGTRSATSPAGLRRENPAFDSRLVVEV